MVISLYLMIKINQKEIIELEKQKNANDKLSQSTHGNLRFDANDIKRGLRLMDLSEEDLEMGMEIITRTKNTCQEMKEKY